MNYECNQTGCPERHATKDEICQPTFHQPVDKSLLKINFIDWGMGYAHDMPCAIYHDTNHAVLNSNIGVFEPSWKAQGEGWRLVKANTKFQKWLLNKFFNRRRR